MRLTTLSLFLHPQLHFSLLGITADPLPGIQKELAAAHNAGDEMLAAQALARMEDEEQKRKTWAVSLLLLRVPHNFSTRSADEPMIACPRTPTSASFSSRILCAAMPNSHLHRARSTVLTLGPHFNTFFISSGDTITSRLLTNCYSHWPRRESWMVLSRPPGRRARRESQRRLSGERREGVTWRSRTIRSAIKKQHLYRRRIQAETESTTPLDRQSLSAQGR
jgi:hypothetical protein